MKTYTDIQGNKYTDHSPDNSMQIIESHTNSELLYIEELDYCTTEKERNANPNLIELYEDEDEGGGGIEYQINSRINLLHSTGNSDYDRSKYIELATNLFYDLNNGMIYKVKDATDQYTSPDIDIFTEPEDTLKTEEQLAEDGYTTNPYNIVSQINFEIMFDQLIQINKIRDHWKADHSTNQPVS